MELIKVLSSVNNIFEGGLLWSFIFLMSGAFEQAANISFIRFHFVFPKAWYSKCLCYRLTSDEYATHFSLLPSMAY